MGQILPAGCARPNVAVPQPPADLVSWVADQLTLRSRGVARESQLRPGVRHRVEHVHVIEALDVQEAPADDVHLQRESPSIAQVLSKTPFKRLTPI